MRLEMYSARMPATTREIAVTVMSCFARMPTAGPIGVSGANAKKRTFGRYSLSTFAAYTCVIVSPVWLEILKVTGSPLLASRRSLARSTPLRL